MYDDNTESTFALNYVIPQPRPLGKGHPPFLMPEKRWARFLQPHPSVPKESVLSVHHTYTQPKALCSMLTSWWETLARWGGSGSSRNDPSLPCTMSSTQGTSHLKCHPWKMYYSLFLIPKAQDQVKNSAKLLLHMENIYIQGVPKNVCTVWIIINFSGLNMKININWTLSC